MAKFYRKTLRTGSHRPLGRVHWRVKRLGVIVNPIAGIGGKVGLKGSDSPAIVRRSREMGAVEVSTQRAIEALSIVAGIKDDVEVIT